MKTAVVHPAHIYELLETELGLVAQCRAHLDQVLRGQLGRHLADRDPTVELLAEALGKARGQRFRGGLGGVQGGAPFS
jgi:hypothetical protein